ncbi:MAG: (2Fe-2S)-binding protein [Deltaproteobacteria bacterium]|nr:(2Fe-2S)-binding protein [Deltaproteobacteria bacterium]
MKVTFDDKELTAEPGQTILEVARANGIFIPTLCDSSGLEPAAMCRLCTVELREGKRSRFVTACNFPLRQEALVLINSEPVRQGRKLIIELLMSRCPDSQELQRLAAEYGANVNRFSALNDDCVVCGLCARVCDRVGGKTLTLSGRGVQIKVDTAFKHISPYCIGCGACAQICPVKRIKIEDEGGIRKVIIHGKEASRVNLPLCQSCGKHFGPLIDLHRIMTQLGELKVPPPNVNICPDCSRRSLAKRLAERFFEQYEMAEEG